MNVLWWTPGFPPDVGGVEQFAALVVPELARRGARVLVVANTGEQGFAELAHLGVPVVRIPSRRALATRNVSLIAASTRRVEEVKAEFKPDLVHVHLSDPSVYLHLTTSTPGARTVLTIHNSIATKSGGASEDTLLRRAVAGADAIIGVAESVLPSSIREQARRDGKLVAVIPTGIVVGDEPGVPPMNPPVILAVGRLVGTKGFDVLIHAFARSRARNRGIRLRLVGSGPEGGALEQLAADLGVDVDFTGAISPAAVAHEYRRATLVVMPSRREGHPLVAMEAAAAGRAVVGSRIPGMVEVVLDQRTGVLVPVDDPGALSSALDDLLDDPERLSRLGASGRQRAVAEHSLDVCVERHLELYQEVLDRGGSV